MMIETILHITNGELKNQSSFRKSIAGLNGKYLQKITKANQRTIPMNSYLHGVLIPEFRKALNSVGYDEVRTDAQAKEIMKHLFLKQTVINKQTGEYLEYTKRTRDLSTIEMMDLFDTVIKFCAENMNYPIYYPNEQAQMNY